MLANPHAALEREIARLRAELADARAALIAADEARRVAEAIIARIDKTAPRADATCAEPGITLSEATRRMLRDEGHPLFRDAPPAEPFFTWVVSPREAALFGEGKTDA